ncbi:MAG: Smr/MutS family protein [Candidatus Binatus sp.]|uniref:Smr/MutS family protein n=1 Tax=Candidatus Binatus sp. TaxID=2811406 RepID=UPI002727F32F|nr:Smr/MutS family protein [Candidatus Binatus sp.]MDO8431937.1 Smr/MutS family protein [Candidatus Binatus sp.]
MAKKRKHAPAKPAAAKAAAPKPIFASPFKDLKKMLAERKLSQPAPGIAANKTPLQAPAQATAAKIATTSIAAASAITAELDDDAILKQALEGVRPLNGSRRARMPVEPPVGHTIVDEDAEVIAQLSDLVSGQAPFDISETEEYVEGRRVGLDPRLVSQLRRGEFAVQDHFDLHGMIQPDAKESLKDFILRSVRKGLRTVLVVHGRGLGSPGGRAVLKHACAGWLSHGSIGGHVLAFTSARPADGGAGAMYVLLRRERRREPFDILQGAKRS